jgi:hypothetical protein
LRIKHDKPTRQLLDGANELYQVGQALIDTHPCSGLFDKQVEFIADTAKRKSLLCSRRSGKTYLCAGYLEYAALVPFVKVAYVALTRGNAKSYLWQQIKDSCYKKNIVVKTNEQELKVYLTNGSEIGLYGSHNQREIEKFRGHPFTLIILDEAASYGVYIDELIEQVLEPTLLDHNGTLCLMGTPAAHCAGYFFEASHPDGKHHKEYSQHSWNTIDNPFLPVWAHLKDHTRKAKEIMTKFRKSKGWSEDNPIWRREYLGEWVYDNTSLVYKYQRNRNDFDELPDHDWHYVIGMDLGFADLTTWVVWAFCPEKTDKVYQVYEFGASGMIVHSIAEKTRALVSQFNPISVVADTGGLGVTIVEEMKQRYALPIEAAKKQNKLDNIEIMNSDYHEGRILHRYGSKLTLEQLRLQWDEDRKGEDPRFDNHFCDAALYGYMKCLHWVSEGIPGITPTDPSKREILEADEHFEMELEYGDTERRRQDY